MKNRGFTLIELLVTVIIIAVLSSIAYPSYISYVQKARRTEAQSALIDLANRQEMYYLDHRSYATNLDTDLGMGAHPFITDNGYYSIQPSGSVSAAVGFTLTATAIDTQAADSDCATLSITHDQDKQATNANGTNCWK
ncbi:prepilin-type cleavage/methylation domain-containing protein [Psychromonas sp. psych-6C06]|uniref:type IV pilin protein n=1 Tax=Psychromonas sp. psych-6C06 TaxID=2058089 RepID=UPI000C31BF5B|nr:type IV pilin protein [Psychromonas sp. psych-6C06]PKF61306.1 prepilin-type cleavage/methylation domain-containing protein [Psychromonas sp. psych-6C06]